MPTYAHADFDQIAMVIGVGVEQIARHKKHFEAAFLWYRLTERRSKRISPSKLCEKLSRVGSNARRLLKSLGISTPDAAPDGPGDPELFDALVLMGDRNADPVLEATQRIGRLVEVIDAIEAATEFDRRAKEAAEEVIEFGKLTVQEGRIGDDAVNAWVADMMGLYRTITGKEPATSVGAPARRNKGKAGGPLIRFLAAAGQPLGLSYSEDAWRSRVRTVLKGPAPQN